MNKRIITLIKRLKATKARQIIKKNVKENQEIKKLVELTKLMNNRVCCGNGCVNCVLNR